MFSPQGLGYDRAVSVFSPDGRLFQVEYAIEAVRRGTTACGIKCNEGCVLAVEKRLHSKLMEPETVRKIFMIDSHIGAAISGLTADARVLINYARIQAQIYRLTYDEAIQVETLTRKLGDLLQLYTQHGGVRPFGVSLLVAGVDMIGSQLFASEPSGSYWGYRAVSIGGGSQVATEILEGNHKNEMPLDDATVMALRSIKEAIEGPLDPEKVEIAVIPADVMVFKKLSLGEVSGYIERLGDGEEE